MTVDIGQIVAIIAATVAGLVAFLKGIEYLGGKISRAAMKWFEHGLEPVNRKLDGLDRKLTDVDLSACKNFLVRFLSDVEQANPIDEVEKERFYETYQHYTDDLHQNTYIHDKVESLKKQGKL